jgi:hypothetical protein
METLCNLFANYTSLSAQLLIYLVRAVRNPSP